MGTSSNIEIRYLEPGEYGIWDRFVDECESGTIFQKSLWLNPISEFQHLNFSIAACFKGGKLIGGMAFTWKKKFGLIPVIQVPQKTPYFGPVFSFSNTKYRSKIESQLHAALGAFNEFILSRFTHFHALFPPGFTDIRPYSWNQFNTGIRYTYVAELHSGSALRQHFDPDIKRRIKKALEVDHKLVVGSSSESIIHAWELEQLSFQRQQFSQSAVGKNHFISFISELAKHGSVEIFTMTQGGTAVASVVIILDQSKAVAYYWMAGAHKDYLSTGLNQLLVQEIIEKYESSGFTKFDLVGADTDTIARYKSTFNFPLVPMYSVSKSSGLTKLGMHVKKLLR